jgi:uncharacterized protein with FMN-binding domain
VRNTTKSILSIVSIGLVAASYKYGIETYAAQNGQLSSLGGPVAPTETVSTPRPRTDGGANAAAPTPTPSKSSGSKPAATSAAKPATPAKPAEPATTGGSASTVTKSGDPIDYNFGTYQVSVTKTNGAITAVDLIQGSYTKVPNGTNAWLVASAVASQGSSFGNISRATYTTIAFKDALDSALAKF